jgi:hypothetical protein
VRKQKFRNASAYRRKGPTKEPYDVVLIVCEGSKTEPNYFKGLRAAYKLSSTNVDIVPPEYGNDPVSIVRFAESQLSNDTYDRAYCVFDRDGHVNYTDALRFVSESAFGRANRLVAIPSVPCFEVWLLLHYRFSDAPFVGAGGLSPCDQVIRALKEHLRDYAKGRKDTFRQLQPLLEIALQNADLLSRNNINSGSENPATKIHDLVQYLRNLRS